MSIIIAFSCVYIFITEVLISSNIIETIASPDGKYVAYISEINSGATTRYSYRLTVLKSDQRFSKTSGNVYVSNYQFEVEWLDNKTLYVKNTTFLDIFKQVEKIYDIEIKYNYYKK